MRFLRRHLALAVFLVLPLLLVGARAEAARVALVVGISDCAHVPALPDPRRNGHRLTGNLDAAQIAQRKALAQPRLAAMRAAGGQSHSVRYTGRVVAEGRIEGTWSIDGPRGTFTMTRQ